MSNIVTDHLRLAKAKAATMWRSMKSWKFEFGDFYGAACEGLLYADKTFNPEFGHTFAYWVMCCSEKFILQMLSRENGECFNYIKKQNKYSYAYSNKLADTQIHVDNIDESLYDLDAAIKKLKPTYREVIRLYLEGKNYIEIGNMLGSCKQDIHQKFQRAVSKLKTIMEADNDKI